MAILAGLKICFIAGTLGRGGAERQLYYMLKTLVEAGAETRVLSLTRGEPWEEMIREMGVPLVWVGGRRSKAGRLAAIVSALRDAPPDVIQSQHFFTNLYAAAAARFVGCREVGAIRSNGAAEVRVNGYLLGNLSLSVPRTLAVNSLAGFRYAARCGVPEGRLYLLQNVVDTDHFSPRERSPNSLVRLLVVARLETQKRVDRAIFAIARLFASGRRAVRLTIAGAGSQRQRLERQAIDLGLVPESVEFAGDVSDPSDLYRVVDLLVIPSDHEGTPNVALEAMASGLPVVATRVGGLPDIISHGENGLLVEPDDEQALYSALREMIDDEALRRQCGQRAREFVVKNCATSLLRSRLEGLYERVLA
jgi:glycosyltransferase involved in cell wall biosynthesis